MSRRASSSVSFQSHGDTTRSPTNMEASSSSIIKMANGGTQPPPRTSSLSINTVPRRQDDSPYMDPDELFTQRTVSEVKAVQIQLRADADAKQEELRLMVGERYRDLLQASTSIISIAQSSKRVIQALDETKETILIQKEPPLPKRASMVGKEDAHLHTLQLLSAHIKLLLDTPEHLWRLIERKKYFQATWLFLLARVVHRALVRDDDQDEESWGNQGIDVVEQFPLIQRQWDAVSHFRSQIIHKATLSLRLPKVPAEDTCATALTLHLLDSRPLTETLSVFLAQRSKAFHAALAKPPGPKSHPDGPKFNGRTPDSKGAARTPKRRIREVKKASEAALEFISGTVKTARDVFQEVSNPKRSMVTGILEYIQSDSSRDSPSAHGLPPELLLNTQTLLTNLPSSTHFLLLPPNLRTYKPYVDLNSSSSHVSQERFVEKLDEWFKQSTRRLHETLEEWFSGLETVQEVWGIRAWIWAWTASASNLEVHEQAHIRSVFNDISRQRMIAIWKSALTEAERNFRDKLDVALSDLREGSDIDTVDASPVEHLFATTPLPSFPQVGLLSSSMTSSLQKYKTTLQSQISGRTKSLENVIHPLESSAQVMQDDFSETVTGQDGDSRTLAENLRETYRPDAEALCSGIIDALESAAEGYLDSPERSLNSLAFVARVADELSSSSPFLTSIGCGASVSEEFRSKSAALDARIASRWQKDLVSRVATEYWISKSPSASGNNPLETSTQEIILSVGPSAALMRSLIHLSTAVQMSGIIRDPPRLSHIANETLRIFVTELLDNDEEISTRWIAGDEQALYDLSFIRKFAVVWVDGWSKVSGRLNNEIARVGSTLSPKVASVDVSVTDFFSRTQVLLAPLLPVSSNLSTAKSSSKDSPEKLAALLSFGVPLSDKQFKPALELAKPSSRFGLLLVGGTAA